MQSLIMFGDAIPQCADLLKKCLNLLDTDEGEMLAVAACALGVLAGIVLTIVCVKLFCRCGKSGKGKPFNNRSFIKRNSPRIALPANAVEIYVGNLSYDLKEETLRKEFEAFGEVSSVRVVSNRFNNKSKGFAFVIMPDRGQAEKAIAALNDKDVLGRKMRVNEAKNSIKEG